MADGRPGQLIGQLSRLLNEGELSDAALLQRFLRHDQQAFALLVRRHAPLVWGVCRRILRNEHDAEDAFQATFLVLARKAAGIHTADSLGGWLHEVATRLALRLRAALARRRDVEARVPRASVVMPEETGEGLRALLDEELCRLPDKYRLPLVLCYLEGKTNAEAADALGWPVGSMSRRMGKARELLRRRLVRRGLALGTLAGLTPGGALSASVVEFINRIAEQGLVSFSSQAAILAEGAMRLMFWQRIKWTMLVVLTLALGGGTLLTVYSQQDKPPVEAPKTGWQKNTTHAIKAGAVKAVALSPDGKHLATALEDHTIKVWDVAAGKELYTLKGHKAVATALCFSPDGKHLATGSAKNKGFLIFDVASGRLEKELGETTHGIVSATYTTDGKRLVAGSVAEESPNALAGGVGYVLVYNVDPNKEEPAFSHSGPIEAVAVSPDGKQAAVVGSVSELLQGRGVGEVNLVDIAEGGGYRAWIDGAGGKGSTSVTFFPDGKLLASGGNDGNVRTWETERGNARKVYGGHKGAVRSIAVSADGKRLASGGEDKVVLVWEVGGTKPEARLEGFAKGVLLVRFSKDGKSLTVVDAGGTVTVWEWK